MSSAKDRQDVAQATRARYRIGAVARATGVRAETLRIWERRYRAFTPTRTPAGGRLYADEDIERLRLIKQLIDRGHAISRIAQLGETELRDIVGRQAPQPVPLDDVRRQFVAAAARLDVAEANRIAQRAALLLDDRALALDLFVPVLREVGDDWARGKLRICHEHAASQIIRNVLGALLGARQMPVLGLRPVQTDSSPNGSRRGSLWPRTFVTATPSGELHEFGATLAALLASARGWRIVTLGANVPADDVVAAANQTGASMVGISVVGEPAAATRAELARLAAELPDAVTLVAGGAYARQSKSFAARARVFEDLRTFDGWLDQQEVTA